MRRALPWLALAPALLACASPPPPLVTASDGRYAMGTILEITLLARDDATARHALDALFAEARRLEALLTVYDEDSQVSRLNREAGHGPQPVAPDVSEVLALSVEYAQLTGGAFDVTVGPLVSLWTRAAERGRLPSADEVSRARAQVGSRHIRVHGPRRVELAREGASVDLGGIAKGYALDRMRQVLDRHGIDRALVNFGQSSTWALGAPESGQGWRLLARGPDDGFLGVLTLRDRALSVSGSLGQFVEIEGRRFGHVLDPRTGDPLTTRRQALVVARDAALAEALSKALLVLGEAEGIRLVDAQRGCEALLVDASGARWETSGWQETVAFEPLAE